MRNSLRSAATVPAILLSIAGVVGIIAGGYSIRASISTTGSVTAAGSINVQPGVAATGFDAGPAGPDAAFDGDPGCCWDAAQPVPVVTAGSVSVLESAWDIDNKTARTIGWRLKTEGAAGDSSNAPTTKLLVQSTADNSTWTTRATLDMAGLLAVTGAITGTTGTFSGDLAVNGSDITTSGTGAATIFATGATSGAMFSAATGDLTFCGGYSSTGQSFRCGTGAADFGGPVIVSGNATAYGTASAYTLFGSVADSATSDVGYRLKLGQSTSGTAAAGLGVGIQSSIEDSAGGVEIASYQDVYWTDATNESEDSSWRLWLKRAGGALESVLTISSLGVANYFFTPPNIADVRPGMIITRNVPSGGGSNNQGTGILLEGEDTGGETGEDMALLATSWEDATSTSEDSRFVVQLRTAGAALADVLTLTAGALKITGDIEAAGGYRMPWAPVSAITDVPASGTMGVGLPMIAVRAGSMTGLGVALGSTAITAGTVSCRFMLDGAAVTGHDVTFSSADAANAVKMGTIAKGEHTFTAGQLIGLACVGSADLAPDNTVDLTITGEMEQ